MNAPTPTLSPGTSFTAALGDQLIVAHGRLRRRRRRRQTGLGLVAAVMIVLLASASLSVFDPEPASAGPVSIETQADGSRVVVIDHGGALPDQVGAALREQNIKNLTRGMPTGPSRVGTIVAVRFEGEQVPPPLDEGGLRLVIPAGFDRQVEIAVGLAAAPGEAYAEPTDAFAKGEPLAGVAKSDVSTLLATAAKKNLRVTILSADGAPVPAAPPGATVLFASMMSSTDLMIRIAA